jgi:hypothetical protein
LIRRSGHIWTIGHCEFDSDTPGNPDNLISEVIRTSHGESDTRINSDNSTTYSIGQSDKYFDSDKGLIRTTTANLTIGLFDMNRTASLRTLTNPESLCQEPGDPRPRAWCHDPGTKFLVPRADAACGGGPTLRSHPDPSPNAPRDKMIGHT